MRAIDYFLRFAAAALFIGFFFLPNDVSVFLAFGMVFAVGLWAVLYPRGIMEWARTAQPQLDPQDESLWWVPRVIGVGFILIAVVTVVMIVVTKS